MSQKYGLNREECVTDNFFFSFCFIVLLFHSYFFFSFCFFSLFFATLLRVSYNIFYSLTWTLYQILEINVTVEKPIAGDLIQEELLFLLCQVVLMSLALLVLLQQQLRLQQIQTTPRIALWRIRRRKLYIL
jgi:magnesium-transporting ATPase (P-type)